MHGTYLAFLLRPSDARTRPGMPDAFFSTRLECWLLMPPNTSLQLKTPCFSGLKSVVQDRAKAAEIRFACWLCCLAMRLWVPENHCNTPLYMAKRSLKYSHLALAYSLSGIQSQKSVSGAWLSEIVCHVMWTGLVAQLFLLMLKNTSLHENSHFSTPAENAPLGILSVWIVTLKINSFDIQSFLLERFICSNNHFKPLWHLLTHHNCCA